MSNVLQALSSCLNKAIEHGQLASMPCKFGKIARLKSATTSAPFYSDAELAALLDAAPDLETQAIILLGSDAGLRAGEIAGLQWDALAFDRVELTVCRAIWHGVRSDKRLAWIDSGRPRDTRPKQEYVEKAPKHDKVRRVPVTRRLASVLRKLRLRSRSSHVLLTADGKRLHRVLVSNRLRIAEQRAGLSSERDGCVHKLRHTFCSALALRGVPVHVIAALAGHHSIVVTQRYMHLSPNSEASAVAKLETAHALETPAETLDTDSATG